MKTMAVHNYYQQPGGEDAVFAAEVELLRRYGHEVAEYREDNRSISGMDRLSLGLQTIWSRSSRRSLLRTLHGAGFDLAHFHNILPLISPSAYAACRDAGVPVVQTLHNYRLLCPAATFYRDGHACEDCLGKTPPWPAVLHACYRDSRAQTTVVATMLTVHRWLETWQEQVDVYVALTRFARKKFIEGGLPPEKVVIKPNFVHPDPGRGEGNGGYVLFVGRLSSGKGVRTLLHAWRWLKGIPLKIIGDGPLIDEVRSFLKTYELDGVERLGQRESQAVIRMMKAARFLVLPSASYEGFPMTIGEAFACGVPVIAAGLGAMAELIGDRQTGLHFAAGDPEDLAAKIEWAWTHPEEMKAMGREARLEYETKYTAERNYEMLIDIYQTAIGRRKGL